MKFKKEFFGGNALLPFIPYTKWNGKLYGNYVYMNNEKKTLEDAKEDIINYIIYQSIDDAKFESKFFIEDLKFIKSFYNTAFKGFNKLSVNKLFSKWEHFNKLTFERYKTEYLKKNPLF